MAECLIHRSGYSAKQGVITVPITDLTVYGGNNTNKTSYEYNGNGVVTATSSNTKVATVVVTNGEVVVTYVSPGSATITVTGSKTNKFKECSTTFNVTCARTSVTIPSLKSTSVAVTGSSVSPGVNNYNSNLITQSGTTSSSSIGTYTVYWNLKDTNKYCWSDGSLTQKSQSWSTYGGTVTCYFNVYVRGNGIRTYSWTTAWNRWENYSGDASYVTGSYRLGEYYYNGNNYQVFVVPKNRTMGRYYVSNQTSHEYAIDNINGEIGPVNGKTYTSALSHN